MNGSHGYMENLVLWANIATLGHLGPDGWVALQRQCRREAIAATGQSNDP
jgi:hypothetical protein